MKTGSEGRGTRPPSSGSSRSAASRSSMPSSSRTTIHPSPSARLSSALIYAPNHRRYGPRTQPPPAEAATVFTISSRLSTTTGGGPASYSPSSMDRPLVGTSCPFLQAGKR